MEYLKTQIATTDTWDDNIELAMFSYNTSVHEITQFSPFQLIYGRIPRLPSSRALIEENLEPTYQEYLTDLFIKLQTMQEKARKNLIKSKEQNKNYYDNRINPANIKEGDNVFLLKEPAKG